MTPKNREILERRLIDPMEALIRALLEDLGKIDMDAGTYIFLDLASAAIREFKYGHPRRDDVLEFVGVMDCYADAWEEHLDPYEAKRSIRMLFKNQILPWETTALDEAFKDYPGGYGSERAQDELRRKENECRAKYRLPPLDGGGWRFFEKIAS
jgi:hypothetical protein